jgi:hypothetical protein
VYAQGVGDETLGIELESGDAAGLFSTDLDLADIVSEQWAVTSIGGRWEVGKPDEGVRGPSMQVWWVGPKRLPEEASATVDPELEERLRALGYVE